MSQVFRRIALRLHGLQRADREWLVANLPQETQTEVQRSLADLEAMGVPRDASWRDALDSHSAQQSGSGPKQASHPDVAVLQGLDVEAVAGLLESEPDWLVACLLAVTGWPWSRDYLAALDPERAQRLCRLARTAEERVGPAFQEALVALLAARVRPAEPAPAATNINRFDQLLGEMENEVADAAGPSEETVE